jgi:hypothetical protein
MECIEKDLALLEFPPIWEAVMCVRKLSAQAKEENRQKRLPNEQFPDVPFR